jgi:hypothetical protein
MNPNAPHYGHQAYPPPQYAGPRPDPMVEAYLRRLDRSLIFLKGRTRKGIMAEARDHLYQVLGEYGDPQPDQVHQILVGYGEPDVLAKEYKELYGYSAGFTFLLGFIGFFVAIFSIPFIFIPAGVSVLAFLLIMGMTFLASWKAGKMSGVAVGLTAAIVRIIGVGILNGLAGMNDMITMDGGAMGMVVFSSILLVVIGYAPGRTVERWEARKQEDFEMF